MKIDSSKLSHLNQDQLKFSAEFLRKVFVEKEIFDDPLNDNKIETIQSIFLATPSQDMKKTLLSFLNHQNQYALLQTLPPTDINDLFDYYDNLIILKSLIKTFAPDRLKVVLQHLYKNDKEKYHELKGSLSTPISIVEGVIITQSSQMTTLIESDIEQLLKAFQSDSHFIKQMDGLARRMEKKYELENLELLVNTLVYRFDELSIGLRNAAEFAIHLKYYHFLYPFFRLFPDLGQKVGKGIDRLILSLEKLPTIEWVFKVLNQLPLKVIQLILDRLNNFERIRQFEKRNIYCKLLKSIQVNLERSSADRVKKALSLV
jgi:hypothetical protein